MADDSDVIRVPVSLQVMDDGDVALTFGPMSPAELLDAVAQLETLDGQVSFHQQLVEGLERVKRDRDNGQ